MIDDRFPLGVSGVMLPDLDFEEQLAICQSLGITYYVYRPRVIPPDARDEPYSNWRRHKFDLTPQRLLDEADSLRTELVNADMVPYCTMPEVDVSANQDDLIRHLAGAATAGCSRIRLSPQDFPRHVFDFASHVDNVISRYRDTIELARPLNVKIVLEMHIGNMACGPGLAYEILRHFTPDEMGVILDLPNLAQQGAVDPALAISVLAPWLDHCHVGGCRPVATGTDALGYSITEPNFCSLANSALYIPDWFRMLAQLNRSIPLVIEDFTADLPGAERLKQTVAETRRVLSGVFRFK